MNKQEMKSVLTMTDKLKADLPHMIEEHKEIVASLDKLINVAKKEVNLRNLSYMPRPKSRFYILLLY